MDSTETAPSESASSGEVTETEETSPISSEVESRVEEKLQQILGETTVKEVGETREERLPEGTPTNARGEVSASTVARMMGLATASEISMLEGKIDLVSSRVTNFSVKLERIFTALDRLPTASDLDRIDINIGSLKTLIRDSLESVLSSVEKEASADAGKLKNATIMSSDDGAGEVDE